MSRKEDSEMRYVLYSMVVAIVLGVCAMAGAGYALLSGVEITLVTVPAFFFGTALSVGAFGFSYAEWLHRRYYEGVDLPFGLISLLLGGAFLIPIVFFQAGPWLGPLPSYRFGIAILLFLIGNYWFFTTYFQEAKDSGLYATGGAHG